MQMLQNIPSQLFLMHQHFYLKGNYFGVSTGAKDGIEVFHFIITFLITVNESKTFNSLQDTQFNIIRFSPIAVVVDINNNMK